MSPWKKGGFKNYEKKNCLVKCILIFFFLTTIACSGLAFFSISAGGKRFSPAKSGCFSGGNVDILEKTKGAKGVGGTNYCRFRLLKRSGRQYNGYGEALTVSFWPMKN